MFRLTAKDLAKRFGVRKLFAGLNWELTTGESLAVVGPNGSGKSTLMLTLLGLLRPSKGSITFAEDDANLDDAARRQRVAFVSPYLNLYDQLTAEENLKFFLSVSGGRATGKQIDKILKQVGLEGRGIDPVGEFSSGMKQRLKYALALLSQPAYLFLDEPSSNLDRDGKNVVVDLIEQLRAECIVVIATNEEEEYRLASEQCRLGQ
jgi:heme exporter protein A